MQTDVQTFLEDLDGGVFSEKLGRILSEVAASVMDHGTTGKVNIALDISRIGSSFQVGVRHKLSFSKPTSRGKISEDNTTETPMHVGSGGRMSMFPEKQGQLLGKHGEVENFDTNTGEIPDRK